MVDFNYLIENFFTHKDFLVDASLMPGTLFTPLHFIFAGLLGIMVILTTIFLVKRKNLIKPFFIIIWVVMAIWEIAIVLWESFSGVHIGLDVQTNLSLYPCSLFLYTMPFAIWGKGIYKKCACGYLCTLGLLGGLINFIYPAIRLSTYSCFSFVGFHTLFFHASLVLVCLVMLASGYHKYKADHWYELIYPAIPSILLSIPANLINYSSINADYMFFTGQLPLFQAVFGNINVLAFTLAMYGFYVIFPALFYLPSYIKHLREKEFSFSLFNNPMA